ncbi:hypothetical protein GX50_00946 [[Emmonsia] crescens]|uniref:Fungal calcium binding protein domain-containing protein n=1 Tax=[Emmonsia] crescens TaxID=73230 RepID=A0A2B7ZSA4_9EURO|nr:hypothetical protein GX50_00946 [Emmonsia crescens]
MHFSKVIATAFALLGAASAAPTEAKRATQVASAFTDYNNAVNNVKALAAANGCDWLACISSLSVSTGSCAAALAELGLDIPLDLACIAAAGTSATQQCNGCFF